MAKIYRRSDRIVVKIDDVTVKLAPMSLHQKVEVQMAMLKGHKSLDIREATRGMALAIQCTLKGIDGVVDTDGNAYQLKFEKDNDFLTDECVDDLMNLEVTNKLAQVCASMIDGIPTKFKNAITNKDLEGVELVKPEKADPEKKP